MIFFQEYKNNIQRIKSYPKDSYNIKIYYAHIITLLETYLAQTFIDIIKKNDKLFQKTLDYGKSILCKENLQGKIKAYILNPQKLKEIILEDMVKSLFFKFNDISTLYNNVLGFDLPNGENLKNLYKEKRNHIIHRNSKNYNFQEIKITESDFNELIVNFVNEKLDELKEIECK